MPRAGFFCAMFGILVLNVSANAFAAEFTARTPEAEKTAEYEPRCLNKIGIKGKPHRFNTVASLSAVRAWTQKALENGDEYGMWHNAEHGNVRCQKLPRSEYYACFASGRPCRAQAVTAAAKTD